MAGMAPVSAAVLDSASSMAVSASNRAAATCSAIIRRCLSMGSLLRASRDVRLDVYGRYGFGPVQAFGKKPCRRRAPILDSAEVFQSVEPGQHPAESQNRDDRDSDDQR